MAIDIGRIAYEGYCKFRQRELKNLIHITQWEHLTREEQDMYRSIGAEVAGYIAEEVRNDMEREGLGLEPEIR